MATLAGLIPSTPGGPFEGLPPLLPVAPNAPSQASPFVGSRGGAEAAAVITQHPTSLGGVWDQNQTPGLWEFFEAVGANEHTKTASFCRISETDLDGALTITTIRDHPLSPLQRADLVKVLQDIFENCGFQPPLFGCAPRAAPQQPQQPTAAP